MKRTLLNALIICALPVFGLAQTTAKPAATKKQPLELKGHVKGLTGGEVILANHYGDKQYIQDTAKIDANGNFVFKCDTAMPGGIYMIVLPSKKWVEVILADEQKFTMDTDTSDLVGHMKITGSKENQYFYEYLVYLNGQQKAMEPLQEALKGAKARNKKDSVAMLQRKMTETDSIVKQYKRDYYKKKHPETFMAKVLAAMDEPDNIPYDKSPRKPDGTIDSTYNYWNFRNHYWDGFDFTDDRLIRTPVFHNKMKFYLDKLVPQHPDSLIKGCEWLIEKCRPSKELFKYSVYYCTYTYETTKIMGFDAVFVHIVNTYYKTGQVWWISETQKEKIVKRADQLSFTLLGKTAVNLLLQDTMGRVKPLHNIKAQYTVVIFWEPTCSHCKKEIPELKEYYDSLRTAGVSIEVYAIVSEMDKKAWKDFVKTHNLTWINVCAKDVQELATAKYYYDVYSTPTLYLLDEQKKIIGKRLDVHALKGFLNHRVEQDKKKTESKPK